MVSITAFSTNDETENSSNMTNPENEVFWFKCDLLITF